jgi:heterodisulfide reductase subunit A-like polyferredoxin
MSLQPLIVGGGPAGMAAAIELARHGVRCTLLEEASRLGGSWIISGRVIPKHWTNCTVNFSSSQG